MSLHRRDILKTTALGSLAGILPITGTARTFDANEPASVIVLTTGLATDMPFAKGLGADHAFRFELTAQNYDKLVSILSDINGREVFALIEPAAELIMEQAARDAGAAIRLRHVVSNHTQVDDQTWAQALGETLKNKGEPRQASPQSVNKLLALAVHA